MNTTKELIAEEPIVFLIPKMSNKYCHREYIRLWFEKERIGLVSNVRFEPIKRRGNITDDKFQKAYITMKGRLFNSKIGNEIMYSVIVHNNKTVKAFPDAEKPEYWLFINSNHNNYLRQTIRTHLETISSQVEQIEKLKISLTNLLDKQEEKKYIETIAEPKQQINKFEMSVEYIG